MPSVLVAMSGGVDSSVAACLLHEQGFDVLGSHMRLVHLDGVDHGCCGPSARRDAAETARIGGFPFEICDLTEEFERTVLADFAAEHEAGRTPNPCARCNGEIKFGAFLRRADELGIDMVASGHYVRRVRRRRHRVAAAPRASIPRRTSRTCSTCSASARSRGRCSRSASSRRPRRARWPSGSVSRSRRSPTPRSSASRRRATPARTRGSNLPHLVREGDVVDPAGTVLGRHEGAFAFTIGQRRGTGVATGERRYVVDVEPRANTVVLGPVELLDRRGLVADRFSWIAGEPPGGGPFEAEVRIRYRGDDVPCVGGAARRRRGSASSSVSPQRAVAPGQSAVLYRGDEVLGGGRIVEAIR